MTQKKEPRSKKKIPTKTAYKKACEFIERHLRREGAHAVGIQRTGKRLLWVQRSAAYKHDNFENFDLWRQKILGFSQEWANKYMEIGKTFTVSQLKGKQLSVQALYAIAKCDWQYRDTLLQYGQRHEASVIRSAYRKAVDLPTVEDGCALIQQILSPPEGGEKVGREPRHLTLPQHIARFRKKLHSVTEETKAIRKRLQEGDKMDVDAAHEVRTRVLLGTEELLDFDKFLKKIIDDAQPDLRDTGEADGRPPTAPLH